MPDYIEREKALKLIESAETWGWSNNTLYDEMKNLPAADVAPVVHAKWAEVMFRDRFNARYWEYLCSSCNRYANREYDYCPNCGAKMDLEEE